MQSQVLKQLGGFATVVALAYFAQQAYLNHLRTKETKLNIKRLRSELGE